MYIKEIKANGFKSFADKINIELDKTFTGIVGPNGSGKSNIVDAVKWVLGEQSIKSLRATDAMSDVIFAGSKTRSPSSSASVTIVFDNTDKHLPIEFNEVSIKRIIYRSGESEYFLNNEKCRLKDITDLFIDSFSSKESFNIISQGKVQEILSTNPSDRRIIFEEAAGVLKYKKRKEESLRKLSRTHENVERINLIISELEESVLPLKEQSEKASIYKEAREKLETHEVALIVRDIEEANKVIEESKQKHEEIEKNITKNLTQNSSSSSLSEESKLKLNKLEEQISKVGKEISEKTSLFNELQKQKELTKERSKYDSNDINVKNNLINLKEEKLKLERELEEASSKAKISEEEKQELIQNLNTKNEEFNTTQKKRELLELEVNNLNKKCLESINKIDILETSLNNLSRLPYAVKSVIDNPRLSGIKNTIGKVIDASEEYSVCLTEALGGAANFVITENESDAKEAINYLKQNKLGRVTFFPKTVIQPKSVDRETYDKIKTQSGFIGILRDLVEFDKEYYNIVSNQIGNIIVVNNIDTGFIIGKLIKNRYRIVTLEGEIIHTGGSLTGGNNKNSSTISEKFEIQRLNNLLNAVKREKESKEIELKESTYNLEVLKQNIYSLTSKKVELQSIEENSFKIKEEISKKLESVSLELKTLSNNSEENLDKYLLDLMEEASRTEAELKTLELMNQKLLKQKQEITEEINEAETIIKKANSEFNSYNNDLREIEVTLAKKEMILDNLLNNLSEDYNLTFEGAREKFELSLSVDETRKIVNELKRQIKSLGEVNLGSIEEYERVSKRYEFLITQKEDLEKSEQDLLGIINEMDQVMKERFVETFDKINIEFNKVFNKLFNGGQASLELTNPENILETGIEIKAIPPGKKLTTISLLSGGEKSLTAISLLFAIMNLNDVPFAILDEVEAALDESNVERFGEYLNFYKNKTQFLIITHKKKTMEYVDLLYGITMQESGVSKLVSVKLEGVE